MRKTLKKLISSGHYFTQDEKDLLFKFRSANLLLLIGAAAFAFNSYNFAHIPKYAPYYFSEVNLFSSLVLLIAFLLLRVGKHALVPVMTFLFFYVLAVFTHTVFFQVDNHMRLIWLALPIMASSLFLTDKIQSLLIATALVILTVFISNQAFYSDINDITLSDSILAIIIFVSLTYILRRKYQNDSYELIRLNKELHELNNNLDQLVLQEVSKNRKKDELLLQQNAMTQSSELLKKIAHHWRQPLAVIGSSTAMGLLTLEDGDCNTEIHQRNYEHIDEQLRKLSESIKRFQNSFRSNSSVSLIESDALIESLKSLIDDYYEKGFFKVEYRIDAPFSIISYKQELISALSNIIVNSTEAFASNKSDNPTLIITMKGSNSGAVINIEDNAGHLTPEVQHQMFDPYFSTKEDRNGTGLGLYMSKLIIEKHCKGTLTIENNQDGMGVQATITLPLETR